MIQKMSHSSQFHQKVLACSHKANKIFSMKAALSRKANLLNQTLVKAIRLKFVQNKI